MNNLAALCAAHHGVVHRHGWTMSVHPNGTATFDRPDGSTLTSPPTRTRRPDRLPLHPRTTRAPETTDQRGRPTTGTRGPATYTTTWDDTPPDQRHTETTLAHRRAHDLPPPLTTAA